MRSCLGVEAWVFVVVFNMQNNFILEGLRANTGSAH